MKKEWKDKWIKALRSGKYEQGREVLRNYKDKYCCLGVLCDIVIAETPHLKWEREGDAFDFMVDGNNYFPPQSIYSITGTLEIREDEIALLNDDDKLSFEEIAEIIENPHGYCQQDAKA